MARKKAQPATDYFPDDAALAVIDTPQQQELPGMEQPRIDELEAAAERYHAAKVERMEMTTKEKILKDILIHCMEQNDLKRYETRNGVQVTRKTKTNVKTDRKYGTEG